MSNIRERRQARFDRNKIKKSDDLYKSNDPGVDISSDILIEEDTVQEKVSANPKLAKRRQARALMLKDYDYQTMAVEYSKENVGQQLGNYRNAMEFLAHTNMFKNDNIINRFQKIIYDYPNVDLGSFANKHNAKVYSWIVQQLMYAYGQKYLGVIYLCGGGMGLLGSMLLDTEMRFENIRSFDINGTCQFLADEFHAEELLNNWRFKATTQDVFKLDYESNEFQSVLQNGKLSEPFTEIPGTIINCSVSHFSNFQDWYNMIPDTKRVVLVGETGDVPRPFPSSQNFNLKFPMNYEVYSGVITVDDKQYYMKIGMK